MNNPKNPFFVGGAIAFLILAGLVWNYTKAIKEKNEIERERIVPQVSKDKEDEEDSLVFEFQQKEKCLKLKQDYLERNPNLSEYYITVEESVIYNKLENTCYLYQKDLSITFEVDNPDRLHESIVNLLTEESVIWYPSAGRWTLDQFLEKKRELGF